MKKKKFKAIFLLLYDKIISIIIIENNYNKPIKNVKKTKLEKQKK
jgi:hypothetical protein